jgi:hypothetical protein
MTASEKRKKYRKKIRGVVYVQSISMYEDIHSNHKNPENEAEYGTIFKHKIFPVNTSERSLQS